MEGVVSGLLQHRRDGAAVQARADQAVRDVLDVAALRETELGDPAVEGGAVRDPNACQHRQPEQRGEGPVVEEEARRDGPVHEHGGVVERHVQHRGEDRRVDGRTESPGLEQASQLDGVRRDVGHDLAQDARGERLRRSPGAFPTGTALTHAPLRGVAQARQQPVDQPGVPRGLLEDVLDQYRVLAPAEQHRRPLRHAGPAERPEHDSAAADLDRTQEGRQPCRAGQRAVRHDDPDARARCAVPERVNLSLVEVVRVVEQDDGVRARIGRVDGVVGVVDDCDACVADDVGKQSQQYGLARPARSADDGAQRAGGVGRELGDLAKQPHRRGGPGERPLTARRCHPRGCRHRRGSPDRHRGPACRLHRSRPSVSETISCFCRGEQRRTSDPRRRSLLLSTTRP